MEKELARRGFVLGGLAHLVLTTHAHANGAPLSQQFIQESIQRGINLKEYLCKNKFESLLDQLESTYKVPQELITAIVGIEGGTPWIGATRTPYFQDTFGTGIDISNGEVRRTGAVGLPQMFNPAFTEAIEHARGGSSSLISGSQIRLLQVPLEEHLNLPYHGSTQTVAYQSELVASYLSRLASWMFRGTRGETLTPEQLIVLSQSYNSGAPSLIDNTNLQSQEGVEQLAEDLIKSPHLVTYLVNGVDRDFARKVYKVRNTLIG